MAENAAYRTLIRPLLTERSTVLEEKHNQYFFEVALDADKRRIKEAVEKAFKVRVEKVRTMVVAGKLRRRGRTAGWQSDWKKAVVQLAEGQKIDFSHPAAS